MIAARSAQLRATLVRLAPERRLYVRSGGRLRRFVLTTRQQLSVASLVAGVALWTALSTTGVVASAVVLTASDREALEAKTRYERLIAERQARLDSAVTQLGKARGSVDELAANVESRHAALALLLTEVKDEPGAADALTPKGLKPRVGAAPVERVQLVRREQDALIDRADDFARSRAERLRLAFRLAGVNPARHAGGDAALGGPLIGADDPRALAAVLDVDEDFARRIQRVTARLSEVRALDAASDALPLAEPSAEARLTSRYGVRFDPFTTAPAFHAGQDFAAGYMSAVESTAPGVVSYAGPRSGYGNTVEVDHGGGFKTRYAHLAAINVRPGQRVALGHKLGGMGSTGRSTGVHLHYEVWVNGRAQDPARFLRAGRYVRES